MRMRDLGVKYRLEQLAAQFPTVPWRAPLPVEWMSGEKTFACRTCIVNLGFKKTSSHQWDTEDEAQAHILKDHMLAALS